MTTGVPSESKLLYSIHEVQALTGLSRTKLYDLMDRGRLTRLKEGRRTLIAADDLRGYVESLRGRPSDAVDH